MADTIDVTIKKRKNGSNGHGGGGGDDDENPQEKRIKDFFDLLGGNGSIKIYREYPDGSNAWCKSVPVDEQFFSEYELRIAKAVGSGKYSLRAYHGEKYLRCVPLTIENPDYPPVTNAAEKKGTAPAPVSTVDADEIKMLRTQLELARLQQQQTQANGFSAILEVMQRSHDRTFELVSKFAPTMQPAAAAPAAPGGTIGSAIKDLVQVQQFLGGLGFQSGGAGQNENLTFGQQVLVNPLMKLADKIGEPIGNAIAASIAPKAPQLTPQQLVAAQQEILRQQQLLAQQRQLAAAQAGQAAPAQPAAAPPAQKNAQPDPEQVKADLLAAGDKQFKMMPGARLQKAAPRPQAPMPAPPAPEAAEVKPQLVQKT